MEQQILSVSQINYHIQSKMDADPILSNVAIRGEISNYKIYPSGHHYFTIKDENASLRCVMFRSNASRLKFRPESGMQIIAMGKISVYPRDGAYQLYCTAMAVDGVGDLHAAFEQLKAKLSAQGLFNQECKKKLPAYPGVIGIVTSSAGAAVHDILRVLRKRYPLSKVLLLPVRVQGVEAPEEIVAAIQYANIHNLADLLIVGRGGGSIEDLWAFNDERVAWAIYNSVIPVISAVGHEPDVTISDYVADLRAATPSNAAELAVPDQNALRQQLDSISSAMENAVTRQLKVSKQHLKSLSDSSALQDPFKYLQVKSDALVLLKNRMLTTQLNLVNQRKQRFVSLTAKLDAMSPLKVLVRGYAMIQNDNNEVIHTIKQVKADDNLNIRLSDGTVSAKVIMKKEDAI